MDRNERTIFLGAGFSKWSCDLPLVSQLFDFSINSDSKAEFNRIERLKKKYKEWSDEKNSDNAEKFIEEMQNFEKYAKLTNWYITRRLTEPFVKRYSRRFTWYINSNHAENHKGIGVAREFLRHSALSSNSTIITTNYDMIVEYALSSRGFNYGQAGEQIGFSPYPYPRPIHVTGRIPLLKLHGSVSWSESGKFPDSRCGLNGECVIVPPRAHKRPKAYFPDVWERAEGALEKTSRAIFFGFAFNEYDEDVISLLASGLNGAKRILIIDVVDHRSRISHIFPTAELCYINPLENLNFDNVFEFVF